VKILQINTQMETGGAQRVALLLHEGFRERGYGSEVWFMYMKQSAYEEEPGIEILLDKKPSGLSNIKLFLKLIKSINSYRPDVLITHSHYSNMLGALAGRICGVKTRIAVQHLPFDVQPKAAYQINKILGSFGVYTSNVAVSNSVVSSVKNYPKAQEKQITIIPNGVRKPGLILDSSAVRKQLFIPEDVPIILNIGRLAPQKNQIRIIEALPRLKSNAHLVILGEGELRSTLEKKILDLNLLARVHLPGSVDSSIVWSLLMSADLFVFPSLFEALPLSLIEALLAGVPIVASKIPSIEETLGEVGLLVSPEDENELAANIQKVLDSTPEMRNLMKKASLERANIYSLEEMLDRYEILFKKS